MRSLLLWLAFATVLTAGPLTFPETTKEVQAAADAVVLDVDFPFSNQSDKPVIISKVAPSCTCMSVQVKDGKQRYEPGESGMIRATFDMKNQTGDVERITHLWLQGDPEANPSVKLTVNFHIPEWVKPEPKTVKWDIGENPEPRSIHIKMTGAEPIRIQKVITSPNTNFKHELKTIADGKEYELVITPVSSQNSALGVFRLETDCKLESQRVKQVFALINPRKNSPARP